MMPKLLPPTTSAALNPPPSSAFPYTFFENAAKHPFQPADAALNIRNAWWLMDAAFLTYLSTSGIQKAFDATGLKTTVMVFTGRLSTHCYVASTDDWIILAFRGTQVDDFWSSVIDWAIDARFVPVPDSHGNWVHAGFLSAINEVWVDMVRYVKSLQAARPRPFWITGHSLGAALATLAANLCADESNSLGLRGLYTYGSPRVGDSAFGKHINVPVWRFRNNTDLVTHVPLGLVFRHSGESQFVDAGGHFHRDVGAAHEVLQDAATLRLSPADAQTLSSLLHMSGGGVPLPGFLADHAPVNYAIRIWNCYEAGG